MHTKLNRLQLSYYHNLQNRLSMPACLVQSSLAVWIDTPPKANNDNRL